MDGERLNTARQATDRTGAKVGLFSPDTVTRMEIVNGAGTLMYGSDALAGTSNIITNEPSFSADRRWLYGFNGFYSKNEHGKRGTATIGATGRGADADEGELCDADTAQFALRYRPGPALARRFHRAASRLGRQSDAGPREARPDLRGREPREHLLPRALPVRALPRANLFGGPERGSVLIQTAITGVVTAVRGAAAPVSPGRPR